jgi:hypothetical protein
MVAARARKRGRFTRQSEDALVADILAGATTRVLPVCVRDALALLDEQRTERVPMSR